MIIIIVVVVVIIIITIIIIIIITIIIIIVIPWNTFPAFFGLTLCYLFRNRDICFQKDGSRCRHL